MTVELTKKEICMLLELGIIYAKHVIEDLNEHDISLRSTPEHKAFVQKIESYIEKCQQIINDNE